MEGLSYFSCYNFEGEFFVYMFVQIILIVTMKIKHLNLTFAVLFLFLLIVGCKKEKANQPPTAYAGISSTITLPRDTITLFGSGTDADGQVVSFQWSKLSGPGSPAIATAASASTLVSNLTEGSYVFQLTVTDNRGATGNDTVSLIVNPPVVVTLNLVPSPNPDEVHIFGSNGYEGSDPQAPEIGGAAWTTSGNPVFMRAALKFDLSTIPSDVIVNSATLSLYSNPTPLNGNHIDANYGTDNSLLIQQITNGWTANTVTWVNQPAATSNSQIIIPSTTQSMLDLPNINVTSQISDMIKNNTNYGFLIRLQTEVYYTSRIFCSSKYSDASKHPKLVVVYTKKGQ